MRQNVEKVPIKLYESVMPFGTGFEIGASLRILQNVVKNYANQIGGVSPGFRHPAVPFETGVTLFPAAERTDGAGIWGASEGRTHLIVGGRRLSSPFRNSLWNLDTGLGITTIDVGSDPVGPWSFAFAPNISQPTTFVTARGIEKKLRVIESVAGSGFLNGVAYLPTFDPDLMFGFEARPSLFYYHLNRLWMLYQSTMARRSLIFFTDALNTNIIRGTNFLDFPDLGTAIFRSSASDLDQGASAHLIFAGEQSLSILDGDPTLGNAAFRQLKKSFGIHRSNHVVETSEGACFLASDNMIYLVPRGALEPMPIGQRLKNQFNHLDDALFLGFRFPYLYVFEGTGMWLADLANLGQDVYWSGPHSAETSLLVNSFISDNPFSSSKTYIASVHAEGAKTAIISETNINIGTQILETGYFNAPDAHVRFKRCVFKFVQQGNVTTHFKLTVKDSEGREDFVNFTVSPNTLAIPQRELVEEVQVVLPVALGGEYFFLRLQSLEDLDAGFGRLGNLREWYVEYRVDPRKY